MAGTGRRILIFYSGCNETSLQPASNHKETLHHEVLRKHQAWHKEEKVIQHPLDVLDPVISPETSGQGTRTIKSLLQRGFASNWLAATSDRYPEESLSLSPTLAIQLTLAWENVHASLWLHYFKGVTYCFQTHENFGPTHMLSLAFPYSHLYHKKEFDVGRA